MITGLSTSTLTTLLAFLQPLAPTQSEAPFLVAQLAVLAIFLVLGFLAAKRFHPAASARG